MDDYGKAGTAKHRRMWELRGISQAQIGALCKPKMMQGGVSQFEQGLHRMTWRLAVRLAPAYFPELNKKNPHHAALSVWRLWFANVEAYGDDVMQRFASEIKADIETDIKTFADEYPLLATAVSEATAEIIPMGSKDGAGVRKAVNP